MKNHPMGAELFHEDGQMDGQTHVTKLTVDLCNFVNMLKKYI